jgi:hypothetical protein
MGSRAKRTDDAFCERTSGRRTILHSIPTRVFVVAAFAVAAMFMTTTPAVASVYQDWRWMNIYDGSDFYCGDGTSILWMDSGANDSEALNSASHGVFCGSSLVMPPGGLWAQTSKLVYFGGWMACGSPVSRSNAIATTGMSSGYQSATCGHGRYYQGLANYGMWVTGTWHDSGIYPHSSGQDYYF